MKIIAREDFKMDAIEFVKKFGIKEAKDQLENPKLVYGVQVDYNFMNDLKQIVEAFDLVGRKGGVEISKEILETWAFMLAVKAKVGRLAEMLAEDYDTLKQAIELVEKCNES